MGAKFLIDTNAVIELVTGLLPPTGSSWVNEVVWRDEHALSVINEIELLMLRTISIGCLGRAFSEVAKAAFQRPGQITA